MLENKYKQGEIVHEKIRPSQKMVVERFANGIYYCRLIEAPHRKVLAYLERDLMVDKPTVIRELVPSRWVLAPLSKTHDYSEQLKIKIK